MEYGKLVLDRYSCRKLTDAPVEQEKIDYIIRCATSAPTAVNYQPVRIWVAKSDEAKRSIAESTRFTFGAGVFMVVGAKADGAWVRPADSENFAVVDASIVATQLMLAIHDCGLRSTWVGKFDPQVLKVAFPEMKDYNLIAIFPIGYPAPDAEPSDRHSQRKDIVAEI